MRLPRFLHSSSARLVNNHIGCLELHIAFARVDRFLLDVHEVRLHVRRQRIREIPDFTDDIVAELLGSTIRTLSAHIDEWMKSLAEYESAYVICFCPVDALMRRATPDLDWPDVRRFLDELSSEMQLDIERLSRSVESFVKIGKRGTRHLRTFASADAQYCSKVSR